MNALTIHRVRRPHWPRLMSVEDAADYLSVGVTMLRTHGPQPRRWRGRVLYDIRDLDRFADRLGDQPLDARAEQDEAAEIERRFLEEMRGGD